MAKAKKSSIEKAALKEMRKKQPGKERREQAKAEAASRRGSPVRPSQVVTPKKVKESRRARIKEKIRKEEW
jgi:hypothetical protein